MPVQINRKSIENHPDLEFDYISLSMWFLKWESLVEKFSLMQLGLQHGRKEMRVV